MMMQSRPASALEMIKPEFVLRFTVHLLVCPVLLHHSRDLQKRRAGRFGISLRPFTRNKHPLIGPQQG
jgi:hypothetical protein